MRSDVKQIVENEFWTRQMLQFIHPRYALSKYQRKYGACSNLKDQSERSKCVEQQKSKMDDMMIFAQYHKKKNTKCVEEGMLSGYDWKYVQKHCWGKIIKVMEKSYPLSEEEKENLKGIETRK